MEPWRRLDSATEEEARRLLQACCGSARWVDRMMARRPFSSEDALLSAAHDEWFALERGDWLEAFAHHPRIGDRQSLETRFPATADMSRREQSGVANASADVLDALADANRTYEEKFGYIFIVCATGRSAGEMLDIVRQRLPNDPVEEIRIAAGEQAKITRLRLLKLS